MSMRLLTSFAPLLLVAACRTASVPARAPSGTAAPTPSASDFLIQTAPGYIAHVHGARSLARGVRAPAVVLLGGSGGGIGWQDYMAERLAQRGIVAMSVAYFALDSLPRELERIPLETFDRAIAWLTAQRYVDPSRIGIGGVSKGAEAALLIASAHRELKAVGVFSPSAFVFQSVTRDFRRSSSWTRQGVDVPYIPYGNAPQGSALVEFYRAGVQSADAATLDAATIRVERITSPILLLSGRDDSLWGSGEWADRLALRLKEKGHVAVENIVYEHAGHLISSIRTDDVTFRGGTKAGNDFAQADGQRRFLAFFEQALRRR